MYDLLQHWTAIVLIGTWIALLLLVRRHAVRGTIVSLEEAPIAGGLLPATLVVRTDGGREVVARFGGCVRCQVDARPGARVRLIRDRDGYVVAGGDAVRASCATGEGGCR